MQIRERDGVTHIVVTQQVSQKSESLRPGADDITPDASSSVVVGNNTIEWGNCLGHWHQSQYHKVYHCFARTRRLSGSGDYEAEAHAALIKGTAQGVEYEDEIVFSQFTDTCAEVVKTNQTAETCQSPLFFTGIPQWWYVVSGHYFDLGANGTQDATCSGCVDWRFEHTS